MPADKKQADFYPYVQAAAKSNSKGIQFILLLALALLVALAAGEVVVAEPTKKDAENDHDNQPARATPKLSFNDFFDLPIFPIGPSKVLSEPALVQETRVENTDKKLSDLELVDKAKSALLKRYREYSDSIGDREKTPAEVNILLQMLDDLIKIDSKNAEFYRERAEARIVSNLTEKAIEDFTDAIKLDPYPELYFERGVCYGRLESYPLAIVSLTMALQPHAKPLSDLNRTTTLKLLAAFRKKVDGIPQVNHDSEAKKIESTSNIETISDSKQQPPVENTSFFSNTPLNIVLGLQILMALVAWINGVGPVELAKWCLEKLGLDTKPEQQAQIEEQPSTEDKIASAPKVKPPVAPKALTSEQRKNLRREEKAKADADLKTNADAKKTTADSKTAAVGAVIIADATPSGISGNLLPDAVPGEQENLEKQSQAAKAEFDTEYAAAQSAYDKLEQYYKDKKIYLDQIKEFADSKYRAPLDEFEKFYDHVDLSTIFTISQWNKVTTKIITIKNDLDNLNHLMDPYSPLIGARVQALKEIDDAKKADAKADAKTDYKAAPKLTSEEELAARRKKNHEKAEEVLAKSKAIDDAQRDRETKILSDTLLQVTYDTKHPYNFKNIDPTALLKFIVDEIKNTKKIIAESSNVSMFQIGWALKCGVMNFAGAISVLLEHFANVDDNRPGAKEMSPYRIPEKRWSVLRNGLKHTKMVSDDKLLGFVKELLKQLTTTTNKEKLVSVSDWLSQQPFFKSLSANLRAKNKSDAKDKKDNINHYPEHLQYVKDIIIPQLEEFSEQKITSDKSAKINKAALRAIIIHAVEPFNSEWQKSLTEREKEDPLTKAILLGRQTIYGKYGAHELPRPEEEVDDQLLKNVRLLFLQVNAAVATKPATQDSKASATVVPAVVTNHQKNRKPNRQPTIVTAPGGSAGGPAVDARVLPAVVRSRKKPPPSRVKPKPVGGVAAAAAGEAAPLVVTLKL